MKFPGTTAAGASLGWLVVSVSAAMGQSLPVEHVTVDAQKLAPPAKMRDFIRTYTARSVVAGKMARWKDGICPVVSGLPSAHGKFVMERVRQVAGMAGAPLADAKFCKPNIDIVFTLQPQVLLDEVRKKHHVFLGYHDVAAEERLATVTHPVQAWYTTQTVDVFGARYVDDRLRHNGGFVIAGAMGSANIPDIPAVHVTGSHLNDGLSSELYHVIITVDLAKVKGQTVGALADYVALLSLAQTQSFEACAPVASITNLVSQGCDAEVQASAITINDLAYLHGLYSIDPRGSFVQQQGDMAYQMTKGLEKH